MRSGPAAEDPPVAAGRPHDGPPAGHPTFRLIQILRAIAALMVVLHHTSIMLHDRNGLPIPNWMNGSAGVDIFFVISGFVMTISSRPLLHRAHPVRTFLVRRLERIVPLYWLVTTAKVLAVLAFPALALNELGTPWHIAASYLFLPHLNARGAFEPVVVVGWTLNFEMAFYALFAASLLLRRSFLKALAPALILIALAHFVPQPGVPSALRWYEDTMVLQFLFGILLAHSIRWVQRLPAVLAVVLAAAGFAVVLDAAWVWPSVAPWRGTLWGLPAAAIVAAAIALEPRWGRRAPAWMLELGDASYSIYLIHTFALPAVGLLLARAGSHWPGAVLVSALASAVLSTAAGELVYRLIERPLMLWFKGRRPAAIPAAA